MKSCSNCTVPGANYSQLCSNPIQLGFRPMEGFVGPQTQRASCVFFLCLKSGYLVFHFLRPTIPPFRKGSGKNCLQSFSLSDLLGTENAQCRLHSLSPFRATAEFGQLLHHPNPKLLFPQFRARGALHLHFASENCACRAPFHIHIATLCMPLFCDVHVCVSGLFRGLHKFISPLDFLQVAAFVLEAFFHKHGPSPISGFPRK